MENKISLLQNPWAARILIVVVASFTFFPFLGEVHLFDWDEINFAEAAREMVVTGNFTTVTIDYQPFWEKPPLFFWMQALSMSFFGVTEFAARFPNAVAGILTLLLFFDIGRKLKDIQFGLTWAGVYLASILPHFYFVSGIIDPWFNLFIFTSVYFLYLFHRYRQNRVRNIFTAGLLIGLAMLTKGPVGLLLLGLTWAVFLAFRKLKPFPKPQYIGLFLLGALFFGGLWIGSEALQGRFYIIQDFFVYQIRLLQTQDAGHGGPFYYHTLVLLIGCFPISTFAIKQLSHRAKIKNLQKFEKWMRYLFWVVLIVFSIVKTKIVHYSSLCYFPLSFLAAISVYEAIKFKDFNGWMKWITLVIGMFWLFLLAGLGFVGNNWNEVAAQTPTGDKFVQELFTYPSPFSIIDYLPAILLVIAMGGYILLSSSRNKIIFLFSGFFLAFTLAFALIVPKVEYFSQRGAIEFYKSHQGELVYPLKHKSYAHLYYTQKPPALSNQVESVNEVLNPNHWQTAFFVVKAQHTNQIEKQYPFLKKIGTDRGFHFYRVN